MVMTAKNKNGAKAQTRARNRALKRQARLGTPSAEEKADEQALAREENKDTRAAKRESYRFYGKPGEDVLGSITGISPVEDVALGGAEDAAATQASQQGEYERAQAGDVNSQDAIARMKAGLEGFNAAENQALVEQAIGGADEDARNMMRQLGIESGAAGVTGGSLQNQQYKILRNQALQRQRGRMDVLTANIAEKARRLGEYGKYSQDVYSTDTAARNAALDRLAQSRENQQKLGLEASAVNQRGQMFNAGLGFDTQQFNLGQREKELAGRAGTFYGTKGARKAARGSIRSNRLANRGYDIAEQGY